MLDRAPIRRANFFKGTRQPVIQAALTEPRDIITAGPAGQLSQAEKSLLVEQHLRSFEATLPPGTLSAGDRDNIRARAMMGPSSASAILTSVMQAVALVAPTHSKAAVNYYSGAAGVDAKTAEDALRAAGQAHERALSSAYVRGIGRDGSDLRRRDYDTLQVSGSLSNYTSANYVGSPFDRAGMSFNTFSALRKEGFAGTHIIHAAQDAKTNGFKADNPRIARAFAILDRDDGARREQRNDQLRTFREHMEADAELARLKQERDKATGEERAKLDQAIIARGIEISKQTGTRKFLDAAPTPAAREQGRVIELETIKKMTGAQATLRAELGDDALLNADAKMRAAIVTREQSVISADIYKRIAAKTADDTDAALLALDAKVKKSEAPVPPTPEQRATTVDTGTRVLPKPVDDTDAALLALDTKAKQPSEQGPAGPTAAKSAEAPRQEEPAAKGAPPQHQKAAAAVKPAASIKPS